MRFRAWGLGWFGVSAQQVVGAGLLEHRVARPGSVSSDYAVHPKSPKVPKAWSRSGNLTHALSPESLTPEAAPNLTA